MLCRLFAQLSVVRLQETLNEIDDSVHEKRIITLTFFEVSLAGSQEPSTDPGLQERF